MGVEPGEQPGEPIAERGKAFAACWILATVSKQEFERALAVAGHVDRDAHVGGRDAIEYDRADSGRVTACIHHSRPRAVRAAIEVDPRVAKEPAYVIQVVH